MQPATFFFIGHQKIKLKHYGDIEACLQGEANIFMYL